MTTTAKFLRTYFIALLLLATGLASQAGLASDRYTVADILTMDEAPTGVVFEVVSGRDDYLQTALENFNTYQQQLKERFPEIELAIVSHGLEQFALTTTNQPTYDSIHGLVKRITASDVPVTVCGNHARMRGVAATEFPDYVEVAARGPAAVAAYQDQGYLLVML